MVVLAQEADSPTSPCPPLLQSCGCPPRPRGLTVWTNAPAYGCRALWAVPARPGQLWHFGGGGGYSSVKSVSVGNAIFGRKTPFKKNTIPLTALQNGANEWENSTSSPSWSRALGGSEAQPPCFRLVPPFCHDQLIPPLQREYTGCNTVKKCFSWSTGKEVRRGVGLLGEEILFKWLLG